VKKSIYANGVQSLRSCCKNTKRGPSWGRQTIKSFTTREKSFLFLQDPGFLSHRNPFHAFIRDCFKITNWKLSFRSVRSQNGTSHLILGRATSLCNLQTYTSYFLELHYYVPLVEDVDVIYFEFFLKIRNFQLGEYRIIMSVEVMSSYWLHMFF
jgi:hypothetical protein